MSEDDRVAEMVLRLLQNIEAKLNGPKRRRDDRVMAYVPPELKYTTRKKAS